jgi:ribosomal protein S18 acetylase RimI-like enzyme
MPVSFDLFTVADYGEVAALWKASPGVGMSSSDSQRGVARFLERNPSLSFVARDSGRIVAVILCGHDGRRGYISHLAVAHDHRRKGVGRALVERSIEALAREAIQKCHIFVFTDNEDALAFWKKEGWTERVELVTLSRFIADD